MRPVNNIGGDANWPHLHFVAVPGDETAGPNIEDWHNVVVLAVTPPDAEFLVAFRNGTNIQRLRVPVQTHDGMFAMRRGPGDVEFHAVPVNPSQEVDIRLRALTTDDDPNYDQVPRY